MAKLLVVDADRDFAIDRLRAALDEIEVTGIQTTLPFHRFVARHAGFRAADLSTDWVAREWDPRADAERRAALAIAGQAAAAAAAGEVGTDPTARDVSTARPPAVTAPATSNGWHRAARLDPTDRWPL